MGQFGIYFELGTEHILDLQGYDHILFIIGLCALYQMTDWKKVLILVTAFTVGHSITLILAVLDFVSFNPEVIEFLIPISILVTTLSNLFRKEEQIFSDRIQLNYAFALFFGLIHGLGFSTFLKESLMFHAENIFSPLLAFNLGLELGQIFIVVLFLVVSFIFVELFGTKRRDWKLIISSMVAGASLVLISNSSFIQ